MNEQPSKALQNAKSHGHEARYLKFRSYKPKCVESSVPACTKTKRFKADEKSAPQRTKNTRVKVEAKDTHEDGRSATTTIKRHHAKKEKLLKSPEDNDDQIKKPKTETKIQAEGRKSHPNDGKSRNQSKKYKTFDIASFPRVFSTSDLMEKMNEGDDDVRDKCHFDNANNSSETTPEKDSKIADALQNVGLKIDLLSNSVNEYTKNTADQEEAAIFRKVDAMVFTTDVQELPHIATEMQTAFVTSCSGTLSGDYEERRLISKLESKRKFLQSLDNENHTLKTKSDEQELKINQIQKSAFLLDMLNDDVLIQECSKHLESNSPIQFLEGFKNQLEILIREKMILENKIEEKEQFIETMMHCNQELTQKASRMNEANEMICSLQSELNSCRQQIRELLRENYEYKKKNEELTDINKEYEETETRLKEIIDRQKTSLKLLENVERNEVKQLNIYEMENNRLHEIKGKLTMENEKLRMQNERLLNVVALQLLSTGH